MELDKPVERSVAVGRDRDGPHLILIASTLPSHLVTLPLLERRQVLDAWCYFENGDDDIGHGLRLDPCIAEP